MKDKGKRLKKGKITAIIIAAVVLLVVTALIVTNLYIPLKYISAYFVIKENRTKGQLAVTYLDVGYGDSQLVELPDGKVMLIDGGDGSYSNELSLFRQLNKRGVDKIDYLICTSVNAEHSGGLAEIVNYKTIGKAYIPYCLNTYVTDEYHALVAALKNKGVTTEYSCAASGEVNSEYNYFFTFLSPTDYHSPLSEYATLNENNSYENIINSSAVIWLEYEDTAFLFTSDAGEAELTTILSDYNLCKELSQPYCSIGDKSVQLEKCNVIEVAGHGAEDSLCSGWYELTSPQVAVYSVSKNNYMGCPSALVMSNVSINAENSFITQYDGAIKIKVTNKGYTVAAG